MSLNTGVDVYGVRAAYSAVGRGGSARCGGGVRREAAAQKNKKKNYLLGSTSGGITDLRAGGVLLLPSEWGERE